VQGLGDGLIAQVNRKLVDVARESKGFPRDRKRPRARCAGISRRFPHAIIFRV
jgi:hypothetical protein